MFIQTCLVAKQNSLVPVRRKPQVLSCIWFRVIGTVHYLRCKALVTKARENGTFIYRVIKIIVVTLPHGLFQGKPSKRFINGNTTRGLQQQTESEERKVN